MYHLRNSVKKFCDKQFTKAATHKSIQDYYNEKCTYNVNTMQFAICTKSMEMFKLYSKKKAIFFVLIKLLFIKVRCPINVNVSLEANLEGQGL